MLLVVDMYGLLIRVDATGRCYGLMQRLMLLVVDTYVSMLRVDAIG